MKSVLHKVQDDQLDHKYGSQNHTKLILSLKDHITVSSPPSVFSGVRVTRSLVLCVCFVDRCMYVL